MYWLGAALVAVGLAVAYEAGFKDGKKRVERDTWTKADALEEAKRLATLTDEELMTEAIQHNS